VASAEGALVEALEEEAACVAEHLGFDHQHVGNGRRGHFMLRTPSRFSMTQQVLAVAVLGSGWASFSSCGAVDPAVAPGDLFRAGDLQALAVLQRGDELAGFQQAVVRAGVEPGVAALHDLHVELPALQVGLVDGGDLQFAARAGLDGAAMSTTWLS
jgi:hypothetical protein